MEIRIDCQQQQLTVDCRDNGTGFDVDKCIPGKGINNIRTRVQELNGTAAWSADQLDDSDTNKGTCLRISFPLTLGPT
jgi:signal transduction histidine kinase